MRWISWRNYREVYTDDTGRRLSERVIDHSDCDKNSHVLKQCIEKEHKFLSLEDFMILGTTYEMKNFWRKISESLYIKENNQIPEVIF